MRYTKPHIVPFPEALSAIRSTPLIKVTVAAIENHVGQPNYETISAYEADE